jgi:hypothetical protein
MRIDESTQPVFTAWIREQARNEPRTLRTHRRPAPADLRCHPDLCDRLEAAATDLAGVKERFLCGFPVLLHGDGTVFGVAAGTTWMALRLPAIARGAVVRTKWGTRGLGGDWVDVDPWLAEMETRDGTRRLRGWCHAAYDHTYREPGDHAPGGTFTRPA